MAPVGEYYKGSGEKVMRSMKKRYGEEGGKRVFYATAQQKRDEPPWQEEQEGGAKTRLQVRLLCHLAQAD
jgi:hypothetical protein